MIQVLKTLLLSGFIVLATGCGEVVQNYVKDVHPPSTAPDRGPAALPKGPTGLRVSPGSVDATAGNLRMRASVNLRRAPFALGNDRKALIGIGQTHQSF